MTVVNAEDVDATTIVALSIERQSAGKPDRTTVFTLEVSALWVAYVQRSHPDHATRMGVAEWKGRRQAVLFPLQGS